MNKVCEMDGDELHCGGKKVKNDSPASRTYDAEIELSKNIKFLEKHLKENCDLNDQVNWSEMQDQIVKITAVGTQVVGFLGK